MPNFQQKESTPENLDFRECIKEVLREVLWPVGRLEMLKSKPILSPQEVSELYEIPVGTLKTWRSKKTGPKFMQRYKGDRVGYTHEDIINFQANKDKV